jgi:hypothetical protein
MLVVAFRRFATWANSGTIEDEADLSRHRQAGATDPKKSFRRLKETIKELPRCQVDFRQN